jgi:hypothetical protein
LRGGGLPTEDEAQHVCERYISGRALTLAKG